MTREVPFRLSVVAPLILAMSACSGTAIVESSAGAVTVRYSSLNGIDEATQIAQKACAVHRKTACLRNTRQAQAQRALRSVRLHLTGLHGRPAPASLRSAPAPAVPERG